MKRQRLLTCLLASLTLHTAFLAFIPPLLSRTPSTLKPPLWVDLVELKKPSLPIPVVPGPATPARKPDRPPVARVSRQPPPHPQEAAAAHVTFQRSLPPARDLIPPMSQLLSMYPGYDDPLRLETSGDPGEQTHRGPVYDAYLREIRDAVKKHWRVSDEGESKSGTTVLRILIRPDGSLADLDILQSCGMVLHDYEAMEAIKQSFPLRNPPDALLDKSGRLSIRFSFHYLLNSSG